MEEEREGLLGQDTGWNLVERKKKNLMTGRGRLDVATIEKFSYKDTFSFYFSDFPETHGAKEMLKAFKLYGDVKEVVIPPKRDMRGKRFGFARFSNVGDPRVFAVKLDNIIFGATKIHVNIPRFQREWNETSNQRPKFQQNFDQQRKEKQNVEPHIMGPPKVQNQQQFRRGQKVWRKKEGGP